MNLFKERLEYRDGDLYWKEWEGMPKQWASSRLGKRAVGSWGKDYRRIHITQDGKSSSQLFHRVVYTLVWGDIPEGMHIDHIDRNKLNNHPLNLRCVHPNVNRLNVGLRADNKLRLTGVTKAPHGKPYQASISKDGVHYFVGKFDTPEEAANARNHKARLLGFVVQS